MTTPKHTHTLDFQNNYHRVYGSRDAILIESYEKFGEPDLGLKVKFSSNHPEVHEIVIIDSDKEKRTSEYTFHFQASNEAQKSQIRIRAIRNDDSLLEERVFHVEFYPEGFYRASGLNDQGHIMLIFADPQIEFHQMSPEEFSSENFREEEIEIAHRKWSSHLDEVDGDYEQAKLLARLLYDELREHEGVPSDEMKKNNGCGQYQRLTKGLDKGYCENFAAVYKWALQSFGICVRTLDMGCTVDDDDAYILQMGSFHRTTEIFDRELDQWIWIDVHMQVLGAYLGSEGPLNVAELHLFLQNPRRRERLFLDILSADGKETQRVRLVDSPIDAWHYFDGRGNLFWYGKLGSGSVDTWEQHKKSST